MSKRTEEIRERLEKASAGPWSECGAGKEDGCPCGQVWTQAEDFPVAVVTRGTWGDDYPAIRIPEPGAIGAVAEPYMERIVYGEVHAEHAAANARFIAHSREDIPYLLARVEKLEEALRVIAEKHCGIPGHSVAIGCGSPELARSLLTDSEEPG